MSANLELIKLMDSNGNLNISGNTTYANASTTNLHHGILNQYIDKTNPFFDVNLNGTATWEAANETTNTGYYARFWGGQEYTHSAYIGNFSILFGPDYTSDDGGNGGWRLGIKFAKKVKIHHCNLFQVKTNARPKYFGLYSMDDTSGTNRTFQPGRHGTFLQGVLSKTTRTIFSTSTDLWALNNGDFMNWFWYEPFVTQYLMVTFGDQVINDGNNNAGAQFMQFFGSTVE
tara:strand:- start:56 stop:745 length:690 start_codon:yes stop_codon:yes gene_type:complete